jgi:PTH1 family peptidyl-tRNA hydrolase
MLLFVGLGNPGAQYANNRHNIGFMAVDGIIRRHSFGPLREKFSGLISEGELGGDRVLILKPLTFMNISGLAVGKVMQFYKIPPQQVVVFHDDLDLGPGKIRVKRGGGNGGHNGLRSLDDHIGKDYRRVRLGIGHPGDRDLVTPYVLGNFSADEIKWLQPLLEAVAVEAPMLTEADDNKFTSAVAARLQPPKKTPRKAPDAAPGSEKE